MERDIQISTHEQEEFEEQDIKNILPGNSLHVLKKRLEESGVDSVRVAQYSGSTSSQKKCEYCHNCSQNRTFVKSRRFRKEFPCFEELIFKRIL